jgi:ribonucleoside-diphosphate reductase alpha chain
VLERYHANTEATWNSILEQGGSVQHLDFLAADEKEVFKTSFEINQAAVVRMSSDRTPFIDQGQSINVFLPGDVDKWEMFVLHYNAWKSGSKSLYYLRSKSVQRAAFAGAVEADNKLDAPKFVLEDKDGDGKYETCEACQ